MGDRPGHARDVALVARSDESGDPAHLCGVRRVRCRHLAHLLDQIGRLALAFVLDPNQKLSHQAHQDADDPGQKRQGRKQW